MRGHDDIKLILFKSVLIVIIVMTYSLVMIKVTCTFYMLHNSIVIERKWQSLISWDNYPDVPLYQLQKYELSYMYSWNSKEISCVNSFITENFKYIAGIEHVQCKFLDIWSFTSVKSCLNKLQLLKITNWPTI